MTSELARFAARLRREIPCFPREEAHFASRAVELFGLQFEHNPVYRRMCEAKDASPLTVTHWSQIPAVPTAAFKDFDVTCLLAAQRTHVFHSSGTTEQRPSRHFHNHESLAVYEASLWPWFSANVQIAHGDVRLMILTPSPEQAPHSSLVHMFEVVRQKLGANRSAFVGQLNQDGSWALDLNHAEALLARSRREEAEHGTNRLLPPPHVGGYESPILMLGTAFSFVHLLDALVARRRRYQLPPGSRVMETGGYKGRSRSLPKTELHAHITERLGVPPAHIVCEYGMSELGSQAYHTAPESPRNTHHPPRAFRFPRWARAQVVSPETGGEVADGETGLLRVFDLANVFSAMAIQTQDLAVRRGDGFALLGRAALAEPRGCSLQTV